MLSAAPREWPILLQTGRVGVEVVLCLLFLAARVPARMTFEGGNLDILVGLTAPLVAFASRRRIGGRALLVVWNVAGLALLANIVRTVIRALPGPLHVPSDGVTPLVMTTAPFIWIPAFVVPMAVLGHFLSLRQLLAEARATKDPSRGSA